MPLVKFKITMTRPSGLGKPLEIRGKEVSISTLSVGDMDERARDVEQYLKRTIGLNVTIEVELPGIISGAQVLKVKM